MCISDRLDAIFEAYEQVGSDMVAHQNGTGLGLAICKQLVELMDGRIWAESEPGHGSSFHVLFPVGVYEGIASVTEGAHSDLDNLPALVIAKNKFVRERYMDAISAIGLSPVGVESAAEAIGALGLSLIHISEPTRPY